MVSVGHPVVYDGGHRPQPDGGLPPCGVVATYREKAATH